MPDNDGRSPPSRLLALSRRSAMTGRSIFHFRAPTEEAFRHSLAPRQSRFMPRKYAMPIYKY